MFSVRASGKAFALQPWNEPCGAAHRWRGLAGVSGHPGAPPIKPRSGQGDHQTGVAALSAILAALLLRQKTGEGSLCETSLIRAATWNLGEDLAATLVDGVQPQKETLESQLPMGRVYQGSDGRWFLVMMPFREECAAFLFISVPFVLAIAVKFQQPGGPTGGPLSSCRKARQSSAAPPLWLILASWLVNRGCVDRSEGFSKLTPGMLRSNRSGRHYWPLFCGAVGKSEWAATPGPYDDGRKRARARAEIGAQLEAIFATRPMRSWLDDLDAAGCIAGPIAELPEVRVPRHSRHF
eukprot:SAG11_NODE_706_length_7651_cov_4.192399_5_plen_295_part_00